VDPEYDIAHVARRITELNDFSEPAFLNTLKEALPPSLWQQAPDALHHAAVSVCGIIENAILDWRYRQGVAYAMEIIERECEDPGKKGLSENTALMADISSDLWGVNSHFLAIDSETYRRLTGSEPPSGARVRFDIRLSGWPVVNSRFNALLSSTTVRSILLALGVIFILIMIQMRSLTGSLIALTPITFTMVLNFAVMGLLGIPLNYTTIMISCIAIGVCVHYTIHFMTSFEMACSGGSTLLQALEETMKTKGSGILINTLVISLALSVLAFSVMPLQRQLGMFIFLTMIFATTGTVTVLPAVMLKIRGMKEGLK
jgi:predicted RND superfamily exporter protein